MHDPTTQETVGAPASSRHLVHVGAIAGAAAAVSTTVVAATASAADVSLDINAEAIPIVAFAWWTLVGAAVGVVLARFLRERRPFIVVTTILAVLSLIPAITAPVRTVTKAVLVGGPPPRRGRHHPDPEPAPHTATPREAPRGVNRC